MDAVFKALADPTRRGLLDMLFRRDGQTLGQLERRLAMTRFGVMKHLRVLEDARVVVIKRRGREKLHYLNAVPIRQIHDRWIDKYAAPMAAMLTRLKKDIEEETMEKVYEIYIKTTPERLWQAITDAERPSHLLRQLRNVSDAERLRGSDQMNEPVDHQKDREEDFHECMLSLTASRGKGAPQALEIMNHGGSKGGPQGIQHRQNVDDFLADGAAHWA